MFFKRRKTHEKNDARDTAMQQDVIFEDNPLNAPVEANEAVADIGADEQLGKDADGAQAGLEEEILEIEFEEDDILCYLVDEHDTEVGFVLLDENGNEVEYYYADESEPEKTRKDPLPAESTKENAQSKSLAYRAGAAAAGAAAAGRQAAKSGAEKAKHGVEKARGWADRFDPNDEEEYDLGITREGVKEATADMNSIYHEGVETIAELKEAFDDINESLHLDSLLGKKRRR